MNIVLKNVLLISLFFLGFVLASKFGFVAFGATAVGVFVLLTTRNVYLAHFGQEEAYEEFYNMFVPVLLAAFAGKVAYLAGELFGFWS